MHLGRYHVRSGRIDAGMAQIIETILQFIQILSDLVEALGSGSADGHWLAPRLPLSGVRLFSWLPLVSSVAGLLLFVLRLLEIGKRPARHSARHRNKRHTRTGRGRHSERRYDKPKAPQKFL